MACKKFFGEHHIDLYLFNLENNEYFVLIRRSFIFHVISFWGYLFIYVFFIYLLISIWNC